MREALLVSALCVLAACGKAVETRPARAGLDVWQYTKDSGDVIRQADAVLRGCYQATAAAQGGSAAGFALEWIVDETGQVAWVSLLGSEFTDTSVEACLIERASSIAFPSRPERGELRLRQRFPLTEAPPQVSRVSSL